MAVGPPCSWGQRLALPLQSASVEDARVFVAAVHAALEVTEPADDYFLHVLGTGTVPARCGKRAAPAAQVLVVGAYKIRTPHTEAFSQLARREELSDEVRRLAVHAWELNRERLVNAFDATAEAVRGGRWLHAGGRPSSTEAHRQEAAAWVACGANVAAIDREVHEQLRGVVASLHAMTTKHGGPPEGWTWGPGRTFPDVFAADEATREHQRLSERAAVLRELASAALIERHADPIETLPAADEQRRDGADDTGIAKRRRNMEAS